MKSAEWEIFSLLGAASTVLTVLIAIAVLVLGLVVVRPLNNVAGIVFAGAGGGRLVGLGLDAVVDALQPKDADVSIIMLFNGIGTLIWIVTAIVFYGGIIFGASKLAEPRPQPGAS